MPLKTVKHLNYQVLPMPAERYFIDEEISLNHKKFLKETEFHHLVHVMRTRPGEKIELVNGRGTLAQATLLDIHKEHATLSIDEVTEEPLHPSRLILAQAFPKPDRLAFILEKGTELGVDEFWLFPGHQSAKKEVFSSQQERAKALTIAAMKQCGRLTLPSISYMPAIEKWSPIQGQSFFGDLDQEAPLLVNALSSATPNYPITFFTGPESGWSAKETAMLKEKGVQGVKLHHHVLRTDTASIAALTLIQHWLMLNKAS